MDSSPSKPTKVSSKFSAILHKFVKAYKSAPSSFTSKPSSVSRTEDHSTNETECADDSNNSKIHPQPFDGPVTLTRLDLTNAVIPKLFDAISSLKLSYVQFQQAHIPHDPEKIRAADEVIVSHLQSLSEIEHLYVENQKNKPKMLASLNDEISEYQDLLDRLQSQAQAKDSQILQLKWDIEELDSKNAELEEEINRALTPEEVVLLSHQELTPTLFAFAFEATTKSIHDFGKPLIGLMKASGWDLDQAVKSVNASANFANRSHKKYAFESFVSRKMFNKSDVLENIFVDNIDSVMRFMDPFDAIMENPYSNFARYCLLKYLSVVHPQMEHSFFGNLDQREFILSWRHPRTPFYRAFVRMARWVWVLQVMASSIVPRAEMYYVKKGSDFKKKEMESVVEIEGDGNYKVGFTVFPGFRIGSHLVRCMVYLSR